MDLVPNHSKKQWWSSQNIDHVSSPARLLEVVHDAYELGLSALDLVDWIRDELGPEAAIADRIRENVKTLLGLPDLVRRVEERFPPKGGAPEDPPLSPIALISDGGGLKWLGYTAAAAIGAAASAGVILLGSWS